MKIELIIGFFIVFFIGFGGLIEKEWHLLQKWDDVIDRWRFK